MLLLAFIVPYPGGVPVPLIFAFVLLVLQLLFIWGVPFYICAYIGLFTAITLICYTSWMSGGIFSPRMAWLTVIPLIAFYAVSRRSGLFCFGLVLLVEFAMSYITWQGWLSTHQILGFAQTISAFASYSVVTLILLTVLFLYDNVFRQAYKASLQRNQELEDKRQELLRTSVMREQLSPTAHREAETAKAHRG